MKLKQLESILGQIQQFESPKIGLEQYSTGAHIASRMIYLAANTYKDIVDKVVADFGCGCGTLGIAASLLDAGYVVGIDVDSDALAVAQTNTVDFEVSMDFVQGSLGNLVWKGPAVDTVIMNPPFGTRKKGADMEFLSAALKIAGQAVYSLHKSSTREHVKLAAVRTFGAASAEVLCELRYNLPTMYKFHKKQEVDIAVDLWRFTTK
eukprot:TRINITY_DN1746_c0_g1_i5.p1 TRINITY_DN1746_c0_g1~~TRINITY_DN1746_c0_g1_i5.p1  ORF type:complete len:207 (-),score=29.13 TRINITY_DN1746_c0_g1_i5:270-890(-)